MDKNAAKWMSFGQVEIEGRNTAEGIRKIKRKRRSEVELYLQMPNIQELFLDLSVIGPCSGSLYQQNLSHTFSVITPWVYLWLFLWASLHGIAVATTFNLRIYVLAGRSSSMTGLAVPDQKSPLRQYFGNKEPIKFINLYKVVKMICRAQTFTPSMTAITIL